MAAVELAAVKEELAAARALTVKAVAAAATAEAKSAEAGNARAVAEAELSAVQKELATAKAVPVRGEGAGAAAPPVASASAAAAAAGRTVTEPGGEGHGRSREAAETFAKVTVRWRAIISSEGQPATDHAEDRTLKLPLSFPGRGDYIIRISNHRPHTAGGYTVGHRPKAPPRNCNMLELVISLAYPLFQVMGRLTAAAPHGEPLRRTPVEDRCCSCKADTIALACPLFQRIYSASQPEFALPSLCRWLTSEQNPGGPPSRQLPSTWAFLRDA